MVGTLAARPLRRSLAQIQYVCAVPPGAAHGLVAAVYTQLERDFGMLAPPVALHSPAPGPLAACWLMLRETLVAAGRADRAAKEAVAAATSLANTCPYCISVHAATLDGLVTGDAAAAIAADRIESVAEPALRSIAAWARRTGRPGQAEAASRPFPADQRAELIGVAVTFQYLNRMVNVFLGESPLPDAVPARAGQVMMRLLGRLTRSAGRRAAGSRPSFELLPAAPLPPDMTWAQGSERVAGAFGRAVQAIEEAGVSAVPEAVRALVLAELTRWDGHPRGPSRAWAQDAVRGLALADQPAGRLALLTAFASYQVTSSDIDELRRHKLGDEALIALTSWSSLAAARTVGTWLAD